jgi:hypothetical protein
MTDASHAPFSALRFYDEWRRQIHDALYDYARTYITRDAWTNMEETMNEVRAMTSPIPYSRSHLSLDICFLFTRGPRIQIDPLPPTHGSADRFHRS